MILAILNLCVTVMPPIKFQLNKTWGLGGDVVPQNDVFFGISDFSIISQNNNLPQTQSCKFHFLRGKRHTDMARKRGQLFKRLKVP